MREEEGFTIIEALVALAILSIALVSLYGVGADTLNVSSHVAAMDRAALFAQSKLDTLALTSGPLPAHNEGDSDGFYWTVTAENISNNAPWSRQALQDVKLTVRWQDGTNARSLTVDTRHLARTAP